ncbi:DsbA family protein [Eionea flava]
MSMTHKTPTLYYIHDPMCSWCWGFRPVWESIRQGVTEQFPQLAVEYIVGGLAPDSDVPMPAEMQATLEATWAHIQRVIPNTAFNYEFWRICSPRRSTYPACRAVLAAKQESPGAEEAMILAIQQAYYFHSRNPSDADTLIHCAQQVGLDCNEFEKALISEEIEGMLQSHLLHYRQLSERSGASGFPSLVLAYQGSSIDVIEYLNISIDYNDPDVSLRIITACLHASDVQKI